MERGSGIGLAQQFLALAAEALLFELQLLGLPRFGQSGKDLFQLQMTLLLVVLLLAQPLRLFELASIEILPLRRGQRRIEALLKLTLPQQQFVLVLLALQQLPPYPARRRLRKSNTGAHGRTGHACRQGAGTHGAAAYH